MPRPTLLLAHSPDPDDAFMWWPITGKIDAAALGNAPNPDADPARVPPAGPPVLDTPRFAYRALPGDIEVLNRRAAGVGDLDITAISFRNYPEIKHRYMLTACGSSFGLGFGPKLVARADRAADLRILLRSEARIAIPGTRTTAFLLFALIAKEAGEPHVAHDARRLVEMPFDRIIPAVARGEVDTGLVIHEGQLLFEQAGLRLLVDVGAWWRDRTGLPTPLGANAVRRDLDQRFGPGALASVAGDLARSIRHALDHRRESLEYTMPFALANATRSGESSGEPPTLDRVDRYVRMYVNDWTVDMGEQGLEAVRRLLRLAHESNLGPDPGEIDLLR